MKNAGLVLLGILLIIILLLLIAIVRTLLMPKKTSNYKPDADEKEALRWANQCAASGEVWGLFQMGEHYRQEEDWEAAFQYDYAAAKQGSSRAMLYLGQMYLNGQGTERDIQAAVQALEGAAARNEAESFEELGNLFYQDELVERDDEKAFYWYGKAYAAACSTRSQWMKC